MREQFAFALVDRRGWILEPSVRMYAYQVREWADQNWDGDGGYETAKKSGWRVRRVFLREATT